MKSYSEFITEGKKRGTEISGRVMTTNSSPTSSANYADESFEGLRRKLIDHYFEKTDDKEKREVLNKCISTYTYALDKKLRISSDIVDMLAKAAEETTEETQKTLTKITDEFYGNVQNYYGTTA